jgi:hypothetical protein
MAWHRDLGRSLRRRHLAAKMESSGVCGFPRVLLTLNPYCRCGPGVRTHEGLGDLLSSSAVLKLMNRGRANQFDPTIDKIYKTAEQKAYRPIGQ